MSKLCLIDPLTLLGRELSILLAESGETGAELIYLHSSEEDEHQIAEAGGEPALVAPLTAEHDLQDASLIVVAAEADSPRMDHLEAYLERHPDAALVDLTRLDRFWDETRPTAGEVGEAPDHHRLRIAHPAVIATAAVVGPLRHLGASAATIAALDPVSYLGASWVETLARQAAHRLQGREVEEFICDEVRAFNQVAVLADRLTEEAAELLTDLDVVASLTLTGSFHGHLVHIGVSFGHEVEESEVVDAWACSALVSVEETPLRLDAVIDRDHVVVSPPLLSPRRRQLAVTAMVDGLRIGGAVTAIEVVRRMLGNV